MKGRSWSLVVVLLACAGVLRLAGSCAGAAGEGTDLEGVRARLAEVRRRIVECNRRGDVKSIIPLVEEMKRLESALAGAAGGAGSASTQRGSASSPSGPGSSAAAVERAPRFSLTMASRLLSEGKIERALNALEAMVEQGLDGRSMPAALLLCGMYLDLLSWPERAASLASDMIAWCRRASRSEQETEVAGGDAVRCALAQSYLLRARALAVLRRRRAMRRLVRELESLAPQCTSSAPPACGTLAPQSPSVPPGVPSVSWYNYTYCLARTCEEAASVERGARRRRLLRKSLSLLDSILAVLDGCGTSPSAPWLKAWRRSALTRKALVLEASGDARAAARLLALLMRGVSGSGGISCYADAYVAMEYGRILTSTGAFDEAGRVLNAACEGFERLAHGMVPSPYVVLRWRPWYLLGRLNEGRGRLDDAAAAYRCAVERVDGLYRGLRSGRFKWSLLDMREVRDCHRRLVRVLLALGRTREAFDALRCSRSTVLLDILRSLPLRDRRRWPERLRRRERELKERMMELRRRLQRGRRRSADPGSGDGAAPGAGARAGAAAPPVPASDAASILGELMKVRWSYELFLREVDRYAASAPASPCASSSAAAPSVRPSKPASPAVPEVRVEYFDSGDTLYAFVGAAREAGPSAPPGRTSASAASAASSPPVMVVKCGPSPLVRRLCASLRARLQARSPTWRERWDSLRARILEPVLRALPPSRLPAGLFLVPCGCLWKTPLTLSLLDERVARVVVGAGTPPAPVPASAARRPAGGVLIYANPDGTLPRALEEADSVAAVWSDAHLPAKVFRGAAAGESSLKHLLGHGSDVRPPRCLHLATHGLLQPGQPLFSSLVLAPGGGEDGVLAVAEIFNDLDLRGVEGVVLSACDTAAGELEGGDELVALSRAFQYAGARWCVASLWAVDDAAAASFMRCFHRILVTARRWDDPAWVFASTVRSCGLPPWAWCVFEPLVP